MFHTGRLRGALAIAAAVVLLAPATAETIVVDDDGGPGVDFTDIPAAVDAADAGDLILVRAGMYTGFVLDKELTVLGAPNAVVGDTLIDGRFATGPIVLSNLVFDELAVRDSAKVVVLTEISTCGLTVASCADVRLHASAVLDGEPAIDVTSSRLEVVQSTVKGHSGAAFDCGGDGGDAIVATDSVVHFALSSAYGGAGGHSWQYCVGACWGGDGGRGFAAFGTSSILVSGQPENLIAGGTGGCGCTTESYYQGAGGVGFELCDTSALCITEVLLEGGPWCTLAIEAPAFLGEPATYATRATPSDPTLALLEVSPGPGENLSFRLNAPPGASALLVLGREAAVYPLPGVAEDLLTSRDRVIDVGLVPEDGAVELGFQIPPTAPVGETFFAQAAVVLPGGELRLTHSVPVVVH